MRQKILHAATCVENGRIYNLQSDIENTVEMVIQLSQFADVENTLDLLEDAFPYLNQIINSVDDDKVSMHAQNWKIKHKGGQHITYFVKL